MIAVGVVRSRWSRIRHPFFRALGWLALAAAAPALFACTARSFDAPPLKPEPTQTGSIVLTANRNVDLLFLVDDSSSMEKSQQNLRRNFPAFMTALKALPGGLPNVHIAVVSSDMGAASGCDPKTSKNGIFQYLTPPPPEGQQPCTTNLNPGATFISDIAGQKNYAGNLEDVFSCIAALGEDGCGFEHQFAAITRALGADGKAPPLENQEFLRPEAYLAIVMITNEDDCSASPGVPLFDETDNQTLADQLGPRTNFRCNEFGHICDGIHPSRNAPNNDVAATVTYDNCTSNDGEGYLLSVVDTANRIKALKADPENQVMVAAIAGPEAPYTVEWKAPLISDTGPWPAIKPSCMASDGSYAAPSTRTSAFVRQFGGNGLQLSICDDEFAPALVRIAEKIGERIAKPCIAGRVAKKPGTTHDDCTVVSIAASDAGKIIETPVAPCADTGGAGPCWQLAPGQGNCTAQTIDVVRDPAAPAVVWETASVQCSLCVDGTPDPTRGCP